MTRVPALQLRDAMVSADSLALHATLAVAKVVVTVLAALLASLKFDASSGGSDGRVS